MCSAPWYAARSSPRSESSAGASASSPAASSCATGAEPRAADDADADGAREHRADDPRLLERQLRLGQAPLQRRQDRDRLERAAPGRGEAGSRSVLPISRLRSAATFSDPSGRRTAHAQVVGPCTSTPFRSAIPPRRSFSRPRAQRSRCAVVEAPPGALAAASPRAIGSPSSSTTGSSSRTDDDVNASSAPAQVGEREAPLARRRSRARARARAASSRVTPARIPRSSEGVKSVEPRRHQTFVTGPSRTSPSSRDEDGVVGAARARLRLGRHVHRVARRLDAAEQPGHLGAHAEQRDEPDPARAQLLEVLRERAHEHEQPRRAGLLAARGPVEAQRRVRLARVRRARATRARGTRPRRAARCRSARTTPPAGRDATRAGTARRRRRAASRTRRGRGGPPRRPRARPARPGRRGRDRRRRARAASRDRHRQRVEQRPRLHPRLLDLGLGLGVPDDAAADPEVDRVRRRPRTCGSSARGRGRRSATGGRARPSTRRGRPARARRCGRRPRSSARP